LVCKVGAMITLKGSDQQFRSHFSKIWPYYIKNILNIFRELSLMHLIGLKMASLCFLLYLKHYSLQNFYLVIHKVQN